MAFNSTVSVNLDAVNDTTIVNATGDVLVQLGQKIFAAVSRLRRHLLRAEQALADAHNQPRYVQESLGAEVVTTRLQFDRLVGLLVKAHAKVRDEHAAQQSARRRMPAAIDWLSGDEWETISNMGSVFDAEYPSTYETETQSESQPTAADTDGSNSSFDLIDFGDEDIRIRPDSSADAFDDAATTIAASSSTEEDEARSSAAAAGRRDSAPHPSTAPSWTNRQPYEFGSRTVSPMRQTSAAHSTEQDYGVPRGWETPAPTPWDNPSQPSSSSSTSRPAQTQQLNVRIAVPPVTAVPSSAPQPTEASSFDAAAFYDANDYDNRIYGYVAGIAVPLVPEAIQRLSLEEVRAVRREVNRRSSEARDALGRASMRRHGLVNSPNSDEAALTAVVIDISAHEADVDKADRLRRVLSYEEMHRFSGTSAERQAQRQLIESELRRLQSGGAPIFWCKRDETEALLTRSRTEYSIWSPAAWSSSAHAHTPAPRQSSSRARSRSRPAMSSTSSSSRTETSATARPSSPSWNSSPTPPATDAWVPRDATALAREQFHDRVRRLTLQRQGRYYIPPCRTVHVSAFNSRQNKSTLQALMRRCGFDVDEDTRVSEYYVTHNKKGGKFHYYGFVTFVNLDAAIRCVEDLDRMDVDRHRGMTPTITRRDGEVVYQELTFSFSTNELLNGSLLRELDDGGASRGRSSSRAPHARRRHSRAPPARYGYAPAEDTDSEETGLEDR